MKNPYEPGMRVATHDGVHGVVVQVEFPEGWTRRNEEMVHVLWDGDDYVCVLWPDEVKPDEGSET